LPTHIEFQFWNYFFGFNVYCEILAVWWWVVRVSVFFFVGFVIILMMVERMMMAKGFCDCRLRWWSGEGTWGRSFAPRAKGRGVEERGGSDGGARDGILPCGEELPEMGGDLPAGLRV
jgi:hypothetical protein